jgi:hypothetical protein
MKRLFDALVKAFLEVGFVKILEWIFWLVASLFASAAFSKFLSTWYPPLAPYRFYLLGCTAALLLLGVLALARRLNRFRPQFSNLSCSYRILRTELNYRYLDDVNMTHSKTVKFKTVKPGVSTFPDRYIWTGEGQVLIQCPIRGQEYRDTGRLSGWNCYEVRLGRTLNKGEECEVELRWTLADTARRAEPFLSTTIREPTDELVMKVTLPRNPGDAICEVRTHDSVLLPLETKQKPFDRNNTAVWTIPNPKLLHHYQMRWYT